MFLKKETFTYNGENIVVSELSALQRIDYLVFISEKTTVFDNETVTDSTQESAQTVMKLMIEINAWLVSRSLSHLDKETDQAALYQTVLREWSYDALGVCAQKVLELSGMAPPIEQDERTEDDAAIEAPSPEKP